uniref:Uncharacterized protein n=1 Tax=viral metagenome TaxID=1070528 RepID=A0A6C0D706_9ZZZZ
MSSPRCTLNRWGSGGNTGNSCSSTPKTEEAKAMEEKLKKMIQERNKLDTIWTQAPDATKQSK